MPPIARKRPTGTTCTAVAAKGGPMGRHGSAAGTAVATVADQSAFPASTAVASKKVC